MTPLEVSSLAESLGRDFPSCTTQRSYLLRAYRSPSLSCCIHSTNSTNLIPSRRPFHVITKPVRTPFSLISAVYGQVAAKIDPPYKRPDVVGIPPYKSSVFQSCKEGTNSVPELHPPYKRLPPYKRPPYKCLLLYLLNFDNKYKVQSKRFILSRTSSLGRTCLLYNYLK